MSDFISDYWSYYITAISLVGIAWCVWLLFSQRRVPKSQVVTEDTGHVWDGDLRELNNPLPRWWMWMFLLACIFSLGYLVLYPGLGSYAGVLGFSSQGELAAHRQAAEKIQNEIYGKYMAMDVTKVAADPEAREIGQRLFLNYCAQCHGSDARGSRGFPNLADNDWLYGGDPDTIRQTIAKGRNGMMPPFAGTIDAKLAGDTAQYVRSLSGLASDPIRASRGEGTFKTTCAACHGASGKGNQALGAPNLSDSVWLYGSSENAIVEAILKGHNGHMPAHEEILTPERIRMLTAYVWGLSNTGAAGQ
ncbi:Cbb3-type cytochrome c oxidase subunit CcoP [Cupriavidus campinensis]|uniref:Cbb3-type cytochrome c oxidase subunit n=1 Tax=Cupriavidus campinensis TaxID=151783 RepID=A0AAE9L0S7_9BURK|nr:cytochrome-c oxidase, cbb3-type subunit III [Cupriavidus campinensis]TSP10677.1 cytochrome-c oxidase, cbb3-type subunit III [Cupriavidus campinensis]URF02861.1 cytochrome-c oxidase, cbb3-type subunit III [Cupriavidus campinensis]CAG2153009.1 Cbb3-type cytochrome c oxidase subunit CcoP [Cupriavidus campinensis]